EHIFVMILRILGSKFSFTDKAEARTWFNRLRQRFLDYNGTEWQSEQFGSLEKEIESTVAERAHGLDKTVEKILG
ncbi:MAG: V-type ATP synthase subunit A, partial [Treponema sp.]|nr:V-type ATP synthase subunit A [Treponema sp.]